MLISWYIRFDCSKTIIILRRVGKEVIHYNPSKQSVHLIV